MFGPRRKVFGSPSGTAEDGARLRDGDRVGLVGRVGPKAAAHTTGSGSSANSLWGTGRVGRRALPEPVRHGTLRLPRGQGRSLCGRRGAGCLQAGGQRRSVTSRARGRTSFRTSATLPRPSPVPVTIGLRTPSAAAGVLPGGTDFSTLGPMSTCSIDAVDVAESAGAVARPKTTSPTRPRLAHRTSGGS